MIASVRGAETTLAGGKAAARDPGNPGDDAADARPRAARPALAPVQPAGHLPTGFPDAARPASAPGWTDDRVLPSNSP